MSREAEEIRRLRTDLAALQRTIFALRSNMSPGYRYQPCAIKIIEKFSGAGGKYKVLILSDTSTAKFAGALTMPEGMYVPDKDASALGLNLTENGSAEHALTFGTPESPKVYWTIGLMVGVVEDKKDPAPLEFPTVMFSYSVGSTDKFGKVASYTPGSNTVTLTPVDDAGTATGAANVDVKITLPASRTSCSIVDIAVNDILAYRTGGGASYLTSVPLPKSTTTYDVLSIQGASGLSGFDSVKLK